MNLNDLRAQIGTATTEELQARVMEIRSNRRVAIPKASTKKTKTFDDKLDNLNSDGLEKLLEILGGDCD